MSFEYLNTATIIYAKLIFLHFGYSLTDNLMSNPFVLRRLFLAVK